jgi:opacity protein-like surface antigen
MMRRFTLGLLAATAIGVVTCQGALAADLLRKAPAPAPLPPPVQDWSGFYVGIEGGGGWGRQNGFTSPFSLNPDAGEFANFTGITDFTEFAEFQDVLRSNRGAAAVSLGNINTSGWLFGAFFGAQKQWGNWVLGIEADVDGGEISGSASGSRSFSGNVCSFNDCDEFLTLHHTASLQTKIDELASVRGKIGYAWSPNWMIYSTGGAAFAHVKNSLTSSQSLHFNECSGEFCEDEFFNFDAANTFTASADQTMLGWTIGAGIDYKWQLDPGSALVFGVEYQYFNFPTQTFTFSGPSGASVAFNTSESINVVKGRISYLFSIH